MHISFFIVLNLLLSLRMWSEDIYTTGLDVKNISPYQIQIKWKANTENSSFSIYRSLQEISKPEDLEKATNIWKNKVTGSQSGSLYQFPAIIDEPPLSGDYYYAVLPDSAKYQSSDFKPTINLTLWPTSVDRTKMPIIKTNIAPTNNITKNTNSESNNTVQIIRPKVITNTVSINQTNRNVTNIVTVKVKNDIKPVSTNTVVVTLTNVTVIKKTNAIVQADTTQSEELLPLSIKNLQIRQKSNSFFLIWKLNRGAEEDIQFLLFRDSNPIYSIKGLKPYKIIDNEFFYEDFSLELGKQYYYAVILSNDPVIRKGKNMLTTPVSFGNPDIEIKIEQEIQYEKITLSGLKTNVNVPAPQKKETVPAKTSRQIVNKTLTDNGDVDKRDALEKDSWNDLQGEEKPSYLLLNKGLSGKKEIKTEKKQPEPLNEVIKKEPVTEVVKEKILTKEILVTNYVEIFKPVYMTNITEIKTNQEKRIVKEPVPEKKTETRIVQPEKHDTIDEKKEYEIVSERFVSDNNNAQKNGVSDPALMRKAQAYFNNKDYKNAVLSLSGDNGWEALLIKGKSHYFLGEYSQALKNFKRLKSVKPQTADLWIKMTMNRWGENQ